MINSVISLKPFAIFAPYSALYKDVPVRQAGCLSVVKTMDDIQGSISVAGDRMSGATGRERPAETMDARDQNEHGGTMRVQ